MTNDDLIAMMKQCFDVDNNDDQQMIADFEEINERAKDPKTSLYHLRLDSEVVKMYLANHIRSLEARLRLIKNA